MQWKTKIDALIRDAVEAATQSDDLAAEQLHKLEWRIGDRPEPSAR